MANELKITLSVVYEKGTLKRQYAPSTINFPQATAGIINNTIAATSVEADFSVASLNTPGMVLLQNLEATTTGKTWLYGLKSSTGGIPQYWKLPPKGIALLYYGTSGMTLRGRAASAGGMTIDAVVWEA